MTLAEQCAVWHFALSHGIGRTEHLRDWACQRIGEIEKPPMWIIDIATSENTSFKELIAQLAHCATPLSIHQQLEILIASYEWRALTLEELLPKLFQVALLENNSARFRDTDPLIKALVYWDMREEFDLTDEDIAAMFEPIFPSYLANSSEIRALLRM